MTRNRLFSVIAAAATIAALGCGEAPTSSLPAAAAPAAGLFGNAGGTGLVECAALPGDSATEVIGPGGGTIAVGPHVLAVPAGAVDQPVAITAVVEPEGINRVRFAPAGLEFQSAASLTMSYGNCGLLATLLPKRIAFLDDGEQGFPPAIAEIVASTDNLLAGRVTGEITHFSSYAIAW